MNERVVEVMRTADMDLDQVKHDIERNLLDIQRHAETQLDYLRKGFNLDAGWFRQPVFDLPALVERMQQIRRRQNALFWATREDDLAVEREEDSQNG